MTPIGNHQPKIEKDSPVSGESPWLGLASFTEETRAFFFGRDDETAELGRRVQRKLLTVLFGQSGLGKTSMLRAGLVPRLRPEGYCPIYVRIDYSSGSPAPGEQIKAAVLRVTADAGTWSRPASAQAGESLWEFFHHRDDVLSEAGGRTLTPLLIFDQFEEIFTLAQTDDTGRARARAFLGELANLVENRAPAAIEDDEASAGRFDFSRADYRVLIALREDYLAHLEGLRDLMPSVTQNRVRLTRMSGGPALEAVIRPGAGLVSDEVARQIVRFVSGAQDLATAEVEPSLLSLVCRELNEVRMAKGEPEISADLLAGSRESILGEFYERSLAGQPTGVRHFIEDVLLTDSGYRESVAEERVRKAFGEAGAPDAATQLVDRRLLRIEERLDVRRVELTHDVLCGVVRASRDSRREREAKERAERELAATRAKEESTRRALHRARAVAAVCSVLALAALGSAIFGYRNMKRAQRAQAGEAAARTLAQAQELAARQRAYASDMNIAAEALRVNNLGHAKDLLDRQHPQPGQRDLRGWEWRYLWAQTRSDALSTLGQKNSEIGSLAVSADGRWLAAGLVHKGGVFIWDLASGREVADLAPDTMRAAVAFSPAEPLLAFASTSTAPGKEEKATLSLWNAATRQMVAEFPLDGMCAGLAFSKDGRTLATSASSGAKGFITLRRVSDGATLARYATEQIYMWTSSGFTATADLSLGAYAIPSGQIRVIDLRDGRELWTASVTQQSITALAFSPDGKTLASAAGFAESAVRLWDSTTGREIGRLEGHQSWVGAIVFWPDGRKLATASADQTIRTWDLASRKCLDVLRGNRNEVWRMALLPDTRTLVSGSKDGVISLWNASIPHPHQDRTTWTGIISGWRFSSDGRSIVTLDSEGQVSRWTGPEFQNEEPLLKIKSAHSSHFSRDGRWLATKTADNIIQVWDLSRGVVSGHYKPDPATEFVAAFLTPGNRLLLYSSAENQTREWDLAANREIQAWHGVGSTTAGGLSPDDRLMVEISYEGEVQFRDLPDQRTTTPFLDIQEAWSIAFSQDAKRLAVASAMGYVRVWALATAREEATLRGFHNGSHSVAFSPDGERLAASGSTGDALKLWAVDSWQEVLSLDVPGSVFRGTAFSPAGDAIGTLSSEGQLNVWRAPTWAEIAAAEKAR